MARETVPDRGEGLRELRDAVHEYLWSEPGRPRDQALAHLAKAHDSATERLAAHPSPTLDDAVERIVATLGEQPVVFIKGEAYINRTDAIATVRADTARSE